MTLAMHAETHLSRRDGLNSLVPCACVSECIVRVQYVGLGEASQQLAAAQRRPTPTSVQGSYRDHLNVVVPFVCMSLRIHRQSRARRPWLSNPVAWRPAN